MKRSTSRAIVFLAAVSVALIGCKAKPTIKLSQSSVGPGDVIVVDYKAPPGYPENAWIGIIPSAIPHGNETRNDQHDITYKYLKGSTSGSLRFSAPKEPGKYDFRMHDTDSNGLEVASVTFEVKSSQPTEEQKTAVETKAEKKPEAGAAEKAGFGIGDKVMVEWKGRWWPAEVIGLQEGKSPYKIHYDGYSNSWDEWVTDARIKGK